MATETNTGRPTDAVAGATPVRSDKATDAPHGRALKAGSVGVLGVMFFVFSAQAPLTGIVGPTAITMGAGNGAGAPAASLIVGVVICVFAVGFIEMSRRVDVQGAFYAYITEALGARVGVGAAWLAILAYGVIQGAMYGLYGYMFSGLLAGLTGVTVPWWLIVGLTIVLVMVLGSRNVEVGARLLAVLVLLEFLLITAFCIGVLVRGGGPEGLDLAASFSPSVVLSGNPGVAVVFAVASMVGFESTAIYSKEAKNPRRTIPLATYAAVIILAVFYAFALWIVVSYYGPGQVADAARAAMQGDTSAFVLGPLSDTLGGWAGQVAGVLLVTSLLAGIIAFHNGVNRYLHSLAIRGAMPHPLGNVNRHHAPFVAARVQSVMAALTVAPFAILGLDPSLTLFPWGGGLAVLSLMVLYILCSVSVVVYFARSRTGSVLRTRVMPVIAVLLLIGLVAMVAGNFDALVGGDATVATVLMALVPVAFIGGVASTYVFSMRGPEAPEPGPFRHDAPGVGPATPTTVRNEEQQ
ncbi:APC family permease [Raineyella sp.]|uniref:Putrescine importer PuuP n=1 Tax=bioreactor metagenome TaxID=1076179 RepID=A0A645A2T6_9ZZZZ|nr:APC family permease [Raineyella sp.]MEA5155374.1 APC family permease [Raineyella sp.]